ncbi:hypothetical protein, partial [Klebsiella grimontii]|uniref:hypothetical protein n=1 Tax=Klebsiella grimontii TaxID=2058152 RepID=UPI001CCA91E0
TIDHMVVSGESCGYFQTNHFLSYMMLMGIKLKAQHGTFGKLSSQTRLHQNGTGKMQFIQQAKDGQDGKFQSVAKIISSQIPV